MKAAGGAVVLDVRTRNEYQTRRTKLCEELADGQTPNDLGRGRTKTMALQMLHGRTIVVVLPAYYAAATLERTYNDVPHDIVDRVLLVDDASDDGTVRLARRLGIETFVHARNLGYGANQKTCYREALARAADIVVMLHPDYQYDPRLITAMAAMIASDVYDVVLGSRILGNTARSGGMPRYKYVANRALTAFQNLMLGSNCRSFTPATVPSRAKSWKSCRSWLIRTISSSTTSSWRR